MAQENKWTVHDSIWHFSVTDPQLHRKGFTVYKVTCKTFPIKAPEALLELVCWKRYNDFKTLYKSLFALHKALHRRDSFPEFAKPKLFGRFDNDVIEERRKSAAELLNFVSTQPHLYKSLVFKQFLEDGKSPTNINPKGLDILVGATGASNPPDLVPSPAIRDTSSQDDAPPNPQRVTSLDKPQEAATETGATTVKLSDVAVLEGTWNFPQPPDNISLTSSNDNIDTDDDISNIDEDDEEDSAVSLPDTDLSFFDPISHDASVVQPAEGVGIPRSNSWLLAGLNMCAEMDTSKESEERDQMVSSMSTSSTVTDGSEQTDRTSSGEVTSDLIMSQSSDGSKVECGKGDLDLSRSGSFVAQPPLAAFGSNSSNRQAQAEFGKQKSNSDKSQASPTPNRSLLRRLVSGVAQTGSTRSNKPRSATEHSVSSMDLGGKEDYIYLAASQICMAQNSEVNGDYEVAFAYYKSGVGILLQGVQGDTNKSRRDAVRRKTAQYLMKAEDLFNRHLATESVDERRWGADSFLSPSLDLDPSFAFIKGSLRELRNFQVLGTIDKVILVRDKVTDETYVIKSIPKSPPDAGRSQSVLPTSCPHMVSLHRFFETDSCVFLLLQYATGGKLWTYIGDYLHSDRGYNLDTEAAGVRGQTNVYSGTKFASDVSAYDPGTKDSTPGSRPEDKQGGTAEDNSKVQSSNGLGAVRFSLLQRHTSATGDGEENSDPTPSSHTDTSPAPCNNTVTSSTPFNKRVTNPSHFSPLSPAPSSADDHDSQEAESLDLFNDRLESTPRTKAPLNRRLSNLSDDVYAPAEFVSPPTPALEEEDFQQILVEAQHNIEDFSINSHDSEDKLRLNSSSSSCVERIPSIPEDPDSKFDCILEEVATDDHVFSGPRALASRQISADQVRQLSEEAEQLIQDAKRRHSGSESSLSTEARRRYAPSFNSDDLIRNSRDLLKQVDTVLSESNSTETLSEAPTLCTVSLPHRSEAVVAKQPSNDSSAEEPSIYDINRSVEEEDDVDEQESSLPTGEPQPSSCKGSRPVEDEHQSLATTATATSKNSSNNTSKLGDIEHQHHRTTTTSGYTTTTSNTSITPTNTSHRTTTTTSSSNITTATSNTATTTATTTNTNNNNRRLSLGRLDMKDLTRSASFERDLKSPTRNRARSVAAMFEQLDVRPAEQVRVPEPSIRKWTAQMITAVSRLHSLGIVCRDLKPSNILLGEGGQVTLTYFCHLGHGDQELDWDAVDNLYAAPEVSSICGYNKSCDWWSIGALLFELLVGRSLSECHPGGITSHTCLYIPGFVSAEARGLLEGLLRHNPKERLGSGMAGSEEIKAHPFFLGVDWHRLEYS